MMTMTFTTRTGVKPLAAATLAVLALGLTACNKTQKIMRLAMLANRLLPPVKPH